MNDLSSSLPHGRLLSYADDTQLLYHFLLDPISLFCPQGTDRIVDPTPLKIWFQGQ